VDVWQALSSWFLAHLTPLHAVFAPVACIGLTPAIQARCQPGVHGGWPLLLRYASLLPLLVKEPSIAPPTAINTCLLRPLLFILLQQPLPLHLSLP